MTDMQNLNVRVERAVILQVKEIKNLARESGEVLKVSDIVCQAIKAYYDQKIGVVEKKNTPKSKVL